MSEPMVRLYMHAALGQVPTCPNSHAPPGQAMPPLPPYLSPGQLPGPLFIYYSTPHPVLLFFFYTNFYHARMHHHANHDLKLLLELGIFLVKLTPELT